MVTNKTLLLIFVTLASVTAQSFQYSRNWTNGKRGGNRREEARDIPIRDIARGVPASLEKIITPCQMSKLKYVLEGKTLNNELLYIPCDNPEDEGDSPKLRYKMEINQEPLLELF